MVVQGSKDRFNCVTVKIEEGDHGQLSNQEFGEQLSDAIRKWREGGVRGVWLRIPTTLARFSGPATELGFDFHHAQPGYVMLTRWLLTTPSSLPAYPHHQIGVGGMVLDAQNRVLCIQERAGLTAGMADFWKLPGGLVDAGEDICDAAVREVLEETGIKTVFECIATVRETHAGPFGCTDLYAICILRLDDSYGQETPEPRPQEAEIAAAAWRELDPLLASKYYARGLYGALLRTAADVALRRRRGERGLGVERTKMRGLTGRPESLLFSGGEALTTHKARL